MKQYKLNLVKLNSSVKGPALIETVVTAANSIQAVNMVPPGYRTSTWRELN